MHVTIFQSTRPSQTSTEKYDRQSRFVKFQSTRPSQTSTSSAGSGIRSVPVISIHEAFADLDDGDNMAKQPVHVFQSTRPSQTSTRQVGPDLCSSGFQSTRPSQTSTRADTVGLRSVYISIHEAFADLDVSGRFSGE